MLIAGSRFRAGSHWLALYTGWAHLFGGVMIILGLLTRVAVVIQLPILIGAVFYINGIGGGIFTVDANLWPSIAVLALLLFFLVAGGGPFSMDSYLKKKLL